MDDKNRPFISAGSLAFPNGSKYVDMMPQVRATYIIYMLDY
jgi:hypothetical protein